MATDFPLMQSIGLLRDVLKRSPIGFLIGAGCPASILHDGKPLVPTVKGLTDQIVTQFRLVDEPLVNSILDRTKAATKSEPNIESILSYIRTLHSIMQDGDIENVTVGKLTKLESDMCEAITDVVKVKLPQEHTPYHRLAAWTLAASGQIRVEFFTTNYDLLLERSLEQFKVPFFDGFVGSSEPFFDLAAIENDTLPARWARVWKLHGSINWRQQEGRSFRGSVADPASSLLIFPSHLKYDESRRLPYVAMADRLLAFLRQDKATLISCGFSYADEHLNDLISSGLRANSSASLFALMFGELDETSLISRFAQSNPRVSALHADKAIIGGTLGSWNSSGIATEAPKSSLVRWEGDAVRFSGGDFSAFAEFLGQMANYKRFEETASVAATAVVSDPSA